LALLRALYEVKGRTVPLEIIVEQAYKIERELMGQAGGFQDYYIAWGGINYLTGKPHHVHRESIVLKPEAINHLEDHLMLVYTGDKANSEHMLKDQLTKLKNGDTLEQTTKIKCLVEEMHVLMKDLDFKPMNLAYPMTEQWELKKQLSTAMVSENILQIEDTIKTTCPVAGIRLIGSGGRGFLLVLLPEELKSKTIDALYPFKCSKFRFDWDGVRVHTGV
jgi:D-glycero-alpha-D-manno-heptose-7-phosphate kinase